MVLKNYCTQKDNVCWDCNLTKDEKDCQGNRIAEHYAIWGKTNDGMPGKAIFENVGSKICLKKTG